MADFDWDDVKNRSNIKKHLISFDEARRIFDGDILTLVDDRTDYGEDRFLSFGGLEIEPRTVVIVVAHTNWRQKKRIISARRANRRERKRYDEFIRR